MCNEEINPFGRAYKCQKKHGHDGKHYNDEYDVVASWDDFGIDVMMKKCIEMYKIWDDDA